MMLIAKLNCVSRKYVQEVCVYVFMCVGESKGQVYCLYQHSVVSVLTNLTHNEVSFFFFFLIFGLNILHTPTNAWLKPEQH